MMVAARTAEKKSRQKMAADNMTPAQKLARALQSGAFKSELRTVSEAIHGARALYKQIELAGIPTKDFFVHIAYLTPDLSALFTQPFTVGQEAAIHAELSGPGMCCIVVGLVFGIRDWEQKNWTLGARVFLRTPLVEAAFKNWLAEMYVTNMEAKKD